ncbi:phage tail sheath family protein [Actinocrinis puniceicyclus]|uniref:Phage tail sheath family protein n=1 Tax=Actinocrinis puniceicyclus TaxID=977794 RepID=A0A8J7WPM2_9ACTN|nr:phage tail sheath subtilisin-like domain-containing protein [Actinocrinis puniceicyclus]MBS2964017.1 phage tail sheath family protein [Actinocrinis puniceicyclus]
MPNYQSPGVYVEELESATRPIEGVGTAVAAFVGFSAHGPLHTPTLVTNWTQYTNTFGEPAPGTFLGHAVYGYFLNGGGQAYVVRVGGAPGAGAGTSARAELTSAAAPDAVAYVATAKDTAKGTAARGEVTVEVTDTAAEGAPQDAFRLVVRGGGREEVFEPVTTRRGRTNVVTQVNATSTLIELAEAPGQGALADRRPANAVVTLAERPGAEVAVNPADYVGSGADRTGFGGLEAIDTVTMVAVPDLMAAYLAGRIDRDGVRAVQTAMIAHCELMGDRMAILDPLPELNPQQVREWRMNEAGYDSKYAALYWPWLKVLGPDGRSMALPPSGHLAGIWARNDETRGVHKAPANEVVRGAIGVQVALTRAEQDNLNPVGVNCIRAFPGRGIRVWGARTLSSDPAWRYINVRRLYNYVESSVRIGTQWVVFEPNDKSLWERVIRTLRSFLFTVWQDGGLFGETMEQAFYVKCDDETNPSESIEIGRLVCEIGLAVVKPAEFVVFRLAQLPTGTALSE